METKHKSTVLLVDDVPGNLQVLGNFLQENNIDSIAVLNGFDALEIVQQRDIDLILLDISMPEIDGYEVCRRLKLNAQTSKIPVVFLTAKTESDEIVKGFEAGAIDYITKPFNFTELLQRVKTQLQLKHSQDLLAKMYGEIEERENYYKHLFFDNQLINLLIDPENGNIIDANSSACDYYGYTLQEITSLNVSDINIISPDEVEKKIRNTLVKTQTHYNNKHKLKSGEVRHVEIFSKKITISNRNLLYSVIIDVEDKIKAEATLRNLYKAVEQSRAAIVITDKTGKIEFANPHFAHITGYSIEEAIGKNPRILKTNHTTKQEYENLWKTIAVGNTWEGEFYNKRKDGTFFWEHAIISGIHNEAGAITHYVAVKEDITVRKKISDELTAKNIELNAAINKLNDVNEELNLINQQIKTEREQFLSLLNSIPEAIYVIDKDSYKILFANEEVKKIFGRDITGDKCFETIQKLNVPCDFCTNHIIFNQEKAHYWQNHNKHLNKHYYLIDRSLKWTDGSDVRFELAIDITKLKDTEAKLERAKNQFEKIFENSNIGINLIDENGYITKVNNELTQILGYSKQELVGLHVNDITIEEDKHISSNFFKEAKEGKTERAVFEKRFLHKNKHIVHAQISSIYIQDNAEDNFYISHLKDITQQKKAEEQLKASEQKYRLITENASDVIWILNITQNKYTYISPSVFQLRGFTVDEAMQQDINQSLTPESAKIVLEDIPLRVKQFMENPNQNMIFQHELQQPCKNGDIIWIETSTRYRYNSAEEIEVVGISRNINERKNHENLLKHRIRYEAGIARFSNILLGDQPNAIAKGLEVIFDVAESARIYVYENYFDNDNFLCAKLTHEICGKNVESFTKNTNLKFINYEKDGFVRWKSILEKNNIVQGNLSDIPEIEQHKLKLSGTKSLLIIPLLVNHNWYGFIGFDDIIIKQWKEEDVQLLRSVSELLDLYIENKQNEQFIIENNTRLSELNATKDKLFSIIAHDLKNPFNSILGFSELLNRRMKDETDKNTQFVRIIHKSAQNAYQLLENLLEWSRSQRGQINYITEKLELYLLVEENIILHKHLADEKQITIVNAVKVNSLIFADNNTISTVIRNLISNAIKFTHQNGNITIWNSETSDGMVELHIRDTGVGMSETQISQLFKIDKSNSTIGTNKEKGTGLGLILCKEFVEQNRGTLTVESEIDKGSLFTVSLPKAV